MSSIEKFDETKLLSKEQFYSKLNDCDISDEEYEHVKKVWKCFNMKTLADYQDVYLKPDVLQLADAFEEFRNVSLS